MLITWKQVSRAWGKESKVLLFIWVSSKLNLPPNNCMPSKAKMMRKRKSRSRREQIAFMELSSELTRSDKAAQCLEITRQCRYTLGNAQKINQMPPHAADWKAPDVLEQNCLTAVLLKALVPITESSWISWAVGCSEAQRCRWAGWLPSLQAASRGCHRTPQSNQSGWRAPWNRSADQRRTSSSASPEWTAAAGSYWLALRKKQGERCRVIVVIFSDDLQQNQSVKLIRVEFLPCISVSHFGCP